jgi:nicotinamidase/pyrazinamidase
MHPSRIQTDDALIVVDVQRDFCSGGALPIRRADAVIPVLNEWIDAGTANGARIIFSRDWHPMDHVSFRQQHGPWPKHCVQNSEGAKFHPRLKVPREAQVVSKGTTSARDNYSAFDDTGLAAQLRRNGVRRVWIGGLAQDVCVRATVLDACRLGFETHLIADGTRPVDEELGRKAIDEMRAASATIEQKGPYESVTA